MRSYVGCWNVYPIEDRPSACINPSSSPHICVDVGILLHLGSLYFSACGEGGLQVDQADRLDFWDAMKYELPVC